MSEPWFLRHAFIIFGIVIFLVGLLLVYFVAKRSSETGNRSILDYLLIWPILFDEHKKNATKTSNKFVIIGLIVMVLLVIIAIAIEPKVR